MSDDKLKKRLAEFVSNLSFEPSKKELDVAVKNIFNDKKKAAKESDDKPKRKLSAWNIFYKEQSAILKASEESKSKDERMSAKEKMTYIAGLWKNKSTSDEVYKEAPEDPDEVSDKDAESEPEPEPEPEPVAKVTKKTGEAKTYKGGKMGGKKNP